MNIERSKADERASAVSLAGLTFAVIAPLTYIAQRMLERVRAPVVNPGLILISTHLGYVWRSAVAAWFGAACAGLVYLALRDEKANVRHATRLSAGLVVTGLGLAWLALRYP